MSQEYEQQNIKQVDLEKEMKKSYIGARAARCARRLKARAPAHPVCDV